MAASSVLAAPDASMMLLARSTSLNSTCSSAFSPLAQIARYFPVEEDVPPPAFGRATGNEEELGGGAGLVDSGEDSGGESELEMGFRLLGDFPSAEDLIPVSGYASSTHHRHGGGRAFITHRGVEDVAGSAATSTSPTHPSEMMLVVKDETKVLPERRMVTRGLTKRNTTSAFAASTGRGRKRRYSVERDEEEEEEEEDYEDDNASSSSSTITGPSSSTDASSSSSSSVENRRVAVGNRGGRRVKKGDASEALALLNAGVPLPKERVAELRKEARMARNRASAERTRLRRLEYTRALEKRAKDLSRHAEALARELAAFCEGKGSPDRAHKLIRIHEVEDADNLAKCKDLTDPRSVVLSGPVSRDD